ncbi:hypothetical protein E0Z10_g8236 [Xylaria hypoxylon]|uniref:UV-damage endonuclease n=1 Tax=Xylaria hypoxylon TaxID=37992 RepID=A0A4Z0YM74_9PEZI|nr:hypothetical protein E0Z10_g8236 [Xylaria hypoxylon]
MGPKRKKSDMASMSPGSSAAENAAAGQSSDAPRRSGRLSDKNGQAPRPEQAEYLELAMQTESGRTNSKRMRPTGNEGNEGTLSNLQDMEDQFRDKVKQQKLAVQESQISAQRRCDYAALMPSLIKSKMSNVTPEGEVRGLKEHRASRIPGITYAELDGDDGGRGKQDADFTYNETDAKIIRQEGARLPPVNSEYLPLPWKGRLGYACLNTYLRNSNPPVFSSRTCRIASIIEHRHPLEDPSQPEHTTKNRPDKDQPAETERGRKYVEALGLTNARDIVKMLRWNGKYGIKFMRLSSEMFPFASHEEYGYKLAPFASDVLADAGRVAGQLGHRVTTHPGQFTQLASPRKEVVKSAVRDLEYHNEMLSLLKLPEQLNKDAVMVIHMGGVFGDKATTLDRFREEYNKLSDGVKARLVLENDDVSWTVHDILPICEELNIPFVLDYHHHNIMFDKDKIREGTKDIMDLYPRIKATWDRKGITQKMHYSEPCSEAVTPRQRRKHRARVLTLPPCPDTMDLMIEAKDKEQAVFELMRTFKLPGWDTFNKVIPYERDDENRPPPKTPKKKQRKRKGQGENEVEEAVDEPELPPAEVPEAELGMGGPDNRVYWPIGMEEWLRPRKREIKKQHKIDDKFGDE